MSRRRTSTSRQRLLEAIASATGPALDASLYGEAGLRSSHEAIHTPWITRRRAENGSAVDQAGSRQPWRMKAAWHRFTSWWVYPTIAIGTILLAALLIARPQSDAVRVCFRLFLLMGTLAWVYDVRWRKRRVGAPGAGGQRVRSLTLTRFTIICVVVGGGWFLLGRVG